MSRNIARPEEVLGIVELLNFYDNNQYDDVLSGKFSFLGRDVAFDSLDELDWSVDLKEKNNPLWQMSLSYMSFVVTIATANDCESDEQLAGILKGFRLREFCHRKGNTRGVWHPYASSHRVINILAAIIVTTQNACEDLDSRRDLLEQLEACLKENVVYTIENLEYDLQFNHLMKNLVALWFAKKFISNLPISQDKLVRLTRFSLSQNFLRDGTHVERSPMYHNLAVLDLMLLRKCVNLSELVDEVDELIVSALGASAGLTHINGELSLFKDCWGSGAPPLHYINKMACLSSSLHQTRQCLPDASYIRFDDHAHSVIWDCGDAGPEQNLGHAHSDFLSYEVASSDVKVITDFGTPTYSRGSLRSRCRSAESHNGPHVFGLEPMECWDSFKVGRRPKVQRLEGRFDATNNLYFEAAMHGGYLDKGVMVARTIIFKPGEFLLVLDFWRSTELRDNAFEVNLLTPAEVQEVNQGAGISLLRLTFPNKTAPQKFICVLEASEITLTADMFYPDFQVSVPATKINIKPVQQSSGVYTAVHYIPFNTPQSVDSGDSAAVDLFVKSLISEEKEKMVGRFAKMKAGSFR